MCASRLPKVALLFSQFAAYHVDRCEAVAARLGGRAEVLAVEVATTSEAYAWAPSGAVAGARKLTLFPGESFDSIGWWRRLGRLLPALWQCRLVLVGVGYNEPDILVLAWLLRLCGVRVVLLSESKFDDLPRRVGHEFFKAMALLPFCAAIVGGARQMGYFRFLGFRRRPVLPGYDGVGLARVQAQAGAGAPDGAAFGARHFIFVGRFVAKKNLLELVDGYAAYVGAAGGAARRLVLVGAGPDEAALRARCAAHGIAGTVDFPGFLGAEGVSQLLARSLALVLVSTVEQWGLVVNEALAVGLPVIASGAVGSRDALVRNLVNGYVIEHGSPAGIAAAMAAMAGDETHWRAMVAASTARAWLGDTERLADAVELLFAPPAPEAAARIASFQDAMDWQDPLLSVGAAQQYR